MVTSEQDEGFLEWVAEFTSELDSHFYIHVLSNEGTYTLWSINQNLFHLLNTTHSVQGWTPLPADEEEVEEEFFRGTISVERKGQGNE